MIRNLTLVLLILYGRFCFALEYDREELGKFHKITQEYQKCNTAWKKAKRHRTKLADNLLMMESECQIAKARKIAEQEYNHKYTIGKARQELESSVTYMRTIERRISDRSLQDRILPMKAKTGSYLDLFNNKHNPKLGDELPGGIINSQGIRTFFVEVETNNLNLLARSLKKKLSKITNLMSYCNKEKTPKHCEFHVTNRAGSIVEKYSGTLSGRSMVYMRLSSPPSESLMVLSNTFPHFPNLAIGDYETMSLSDYNHYKSSIQQMYFWFARYYAEYCSHIIDSTRTISGKWQQINQNTSTVKDEVEYNYQVEKDFYELAKESHDRFVNYQVYGLTSYRNNSNTMKTFFDTYACDSQEVKNTRKGLYAIGNSMNVLSDSVIYNNELKLVSIE